MCVQIRILIPLLLLPCLPKCLHYAGSQHLMLWNKVVSNGLVNYTGVLVLENQSRWYLSQRCCNAGGDMPQPYTYINLFGWFSIGEDVLNRTIHCHMSIMHVARLSFTSVAGHMYMINNSTI